MIGTAKRIALLERLRADQRRREAASTPDDRLAASRRLLAIAVEAGTLDAGHSTDEPAEWWLALNGRHQT